jgi:hypothetical protein
LRNRKSTALRSPGFISLGSFANPATDKREHLQRRRKPGEGINSELPDQKNLEAIGVASDNPNQISPSVAIESTGPKF